MNGNSLYGPLDPAPDAGYPDASAGRQRVSIAASDSERGAERARSLAQDELPRMGFFTDTSVCIGCKACEVACKEWNLVPEHGMDLLGMSYDNTGALTANSWRHVAFVEQPRPPVDALAAAGATGAPPATGAGVPTAAGPEFLGMPGSAPPGRSTGLAERTDFRWLMMSDVCKHCTHAACLDVCPTGSLFRTEFGTVVVQEDICNGCGYCISACPYGVIDKRKGDGRAWKCTLCYDRIGADMTPACAQACPTESIQYGPLDELRTRAAERVATLRERGVPQARLYGHDPDDGVGGDGAFFLLLDEPEVYGLPPDPVVTTRDLPKMWRRAGLAALAMAASAVVAFAGRSR
ncbi:4Fe-4S dicluster domain-containing protein [Plantactinospora sp. GCM10030261]|uniref:4Fe-4S dicluster domain-containing protein n=1 Tax=Plantactinospora sp. GCM10030261 TaxID=3273420 RepID=UPI00360E934C